MTLIILKGQPLSTGSIYKIVCRGRFGTYYVSKAGKDLKLDYQNQVRKQYKYKPLEGSLSIEVRLFFGTKRKCDWDNFHKLSMDALTGIVWGDDSQIDYAVVSKHYCKEKPRIEITVDKSIC